MPTTPLGSAFGSLIRSRRITVGMSQARLGAKVGVSATTIRRWERAESVPADDHLDDLAEVLEVDRADLEAALHPSPSPGIPPDDIAEEAPEGADSPVVVESAVEEEPSGEMDAPAVVESVVDDEPSAEMDAPVADTPVVEEEPSGEMDAPVVDAPVVEEEPSAEMDAPVVVESVVEEEEPSGDIAEPTAGDAASEPLAAPFEADEEMETAVVQSAAAGAAAADALDASVVVPAASGPAALAGEAATLGADVQPWIDISTESILAPLTSPSLEQTPAPVAAPPRPAIRPPAPPSGPPAAPADESAELVLVSKSYLENRWQRLLYSIRLLLTVVALAAMAAVLIWAFTELFEALGDVLDLFGDQTDPIDPATTPS